VNWKLIFLLGIILALSPFNLHAGSYLLMYSILGFGLITLSYLYKEIDKKDVLVITSLALTLFTGIINLVFWYYFFQALFILSIILSYFFNSSKKSISMLSVVIVGLIGAALPLQVGSALGLYYLPLFAALLHYLYFGLTIAVLILDYKNK
jgi:hypothetical protein